MMLEAPMELRNTHTGLWPGNFLKISSISGHKSRTYIVDADHVRSIVIPKGAKVADMIHMDKTIAMGTLRGKKRKTSRDTAR